MSDPSTKKVTVTGVKVTIGTLSALALNNVFPNEDALGADFKEGDALGTIDFTATLR